MNTLPSNDWQRIRAHYAALTPRILAEASNEWATDAYAWDNGMIRMTPIESWLWADIREANLVMYPQYPVNGVFVDFANPRAKVAIECDGRDFHLDKAKDQRRDKGLQVMGWTIYRITGSECREEFDENTRSSGAGRRLVDMIARNHRVQRGRSYV